MFFAVLFHAPLALNRRSHLQVNDIHSSIMGTPTIFYKEEHFVAQIGGSRFVGTRAELRELRRRVCNGGGRNAREREKVRC